MCCLGLFFVFKIAFLAAMSSMCFRSWDGGGLGAGNWSPHDVRRCESHSDLGHGQRDESPGTN